MRLISDLQANNAQGRDPGTAEAILYLVAADQEGGFVARLTMRTRGTGSMAIGAEIRLRRAPCPRAGCLEKNWRRWVSM